MKVLYRYSRTDIPQNEKREARVFFKVKTSEEVFEIFRSFGPSGEERILLEMAGGRILGRDVISGEDLPGFHKASMDGYAVKSRDTFGASESLPALLHVVGEVITGQAPGVTVKDGQAVRISTGGMMPEGADGVIMLEYCHPLDDKTVEMTRSISPLENVILPDDDLKKGQCILKAGTRLRPQDLGVMAGLGLLHLWAYRRPKVAIVSTGDEVVSIDQRPRPGQIRDVNSYTLNALCQQVGAEPIMMGICADEFHELRQALEKGLAMADTVWISGGSSMGSRDLTLKVFQSFNDMDILAHGISISPGKPTIIAKTGPRAVFGLPGHTGSAMIVAQVFLAPFLGRLSGEATLQNPLFHEVDAELSRNIESASGRDDYIRVKLVRGSKGLLADPLFGKSGLISTLVEADGLVRVERNTEGLYQGDRVKVMLFQPRTGVRL